MGLQQFEKWGKDIDVYKPLRIEDALTRPLLFFSEVLDIRNCNIGYICAQDGSIILNGQPYDLALVNSQEKYKKEGFHNTKIVCIDSNNLEEAIKGIIANPAEQTFERYFIKLKEKYHLLHRMTAVNRTVVAVKDYVNLSISHFKKDEANLTEMIHQLLQELSSLGPTCMVQHKH